MPSARSFLIALVSVVVGTMAVFGTTATAGELPNVLFIAIDDMNDWAVGLNPESVAKTPHIDRLASRGVLFTNAHCAAPACNPSRVSVLTGLHPTTSGVYVNQQDWRENPRVANAVSIPDYFQNHGYEVRGGGKLYHAANLSDWGLTGYFDAEPWDEYFPSKTRQLAHAAIPPGHPVNGSPEFYKGRFDWNAIDVEDAETGDGQVVSWAEQQLQTKHDKPLFLAVGIYRPHIPWYTPKKWFDDYPLESISVSTQTADDLKDVPNAGRAMSRRHWHQWLVDNGKWEQAVQAYLASTSFADAMVGRLIEALDASPMSDNTIVVLWSDHGYHLGHKEHWEKFALWEQTTHVPLIVVTPDRQSSGAACDVPVSLLDVFPTLCHLTTGETPSGLDGESLHPWLNTPDQNSDRIVVTTHGRGNHAARSKHWRYIRYADGSEELYDHRTDSSELTNVVDRPEFADLKLRLAGALPTSETETLPAHPNSHKH